MTVCICYMVDEFIGSLRVRKLVNQHTIAIYFENEDDYFSRYKFHFDSNVHGKKKYIASCYIILSGMLIRKYFN